MIRAQVETYRSFPSLDLVPIVHCVPMTQLSLAFDKISGLNIHPLQYAIPFQEWSLETIDDQIQKCNTSHSLKLHLIKKYLSPPQAQKFTSEYVDSIKYYKLETYTNNRFQTSSYHDFEVTQMKYQVRCAASEA